MVSPINSIIHLLFLAIGTFIFKQTKENIKSPHGNMFFSCASFSLAWCFVKRLVKITDDIKRPGVGGSYVLFHLYYRHNDNTLFIKDFVTIPIQCALSAAKIMISEEVLKERWSKLCVNSQMFTGTCLEAKL